jgi:hypothetical protein
MKLFIATTIIASIVEASTSKLRNRQINHRQADSHGSNAEIIQANLDLKTLIGEKLRKFRRNRRQWNKDNTLHSRKECHPTTKLSDSDVGILDCGVDEYCMESKLSSIGGICVNSQDRNLQNEAFLDISNCDPKNEYFGYFECDCSDFNLETSTGSFSCMIYDNYCFTDDICGSLVITNTIIEDGAKADYCYSFSDPFEVEFCYSFNGDSCDIVIDNKSCNSCALVDVEDPDLGYTFFECLDFDCTNTAIQASGNECLGTNILQRTFPNGSESTLPPPNNKNSTLNPSEDASEVNTASEFPTTSLPTEELTMAISSFPTSTPSGMPSETPTSIPSDLPSLAPSLDPTYIPLSLAPSISPTAVQTTESTLSSTLAPITPTPTASPSDHLHMSSSPTETPVSSSASIRSNLWTVGTVLVLLLSLLDHIVG